MKSHVWQRYSVIFTKGFSEKQQRETCGNIICIGSVPMRILFLSLSLWRPTTKKASEPKAPKPVFPMVGGIGLEPMTSSASRKRSSSELTTRSVENCTGPLKDCQGSFSLFRFFLNIEGFFKEYAAGALSETRKPRFHDSHHAKHISAKIA